MLPENLAADYASDRDYEQALERAGFEAPGQADKPQRTGDEFSEGEWWLCGCHLPWWSFRRGLFHFYVDPADGQWIAYESCPVAKRRIQQSKRIEATGRKEKKGKL